MKKIIHIDLDYFFAQVELLERPELSNKPVAIAFRSKRSVLSTCNYIARSYGLKSAMSLSEAEKKCPQVVVISPNFHKYKDKSRAFFEILKKYTDQVEKISIDEAYLDITNCHLFDNDGNKIAQAIKNEIFEKLNLTASVGLSYNKLLAKIGSELFKPNGLAILRPRDIEKKIANFPVGYIQGVGKKCEQKMKDLEILTFGDLQKKSKLDLITHFGSFGERLYQSCRGIDNRELSKSRARKSLSIERTFEVDMKLDDCFYQKVDDCFDELEKRLSSIDREMKSFFVKIKFDDFSLKGRECKANILNKDLVLKLISECASEKKIRLIGMGVKFHYIDNKHQLSLF